MNKQIDKVLQQRMDRKNFLKTAALGVVMMSGAASLVKAFHQPTEVTANNKVDRAMAYGGSAYGGTPTAKQ